MGQRPRGSAFTAQRAEAAAAAAAHTFFVPVATGRDQVRAYRLVPHGQHRDVRHVGYEPDRAKMTAELTAIAAEMWNARTELSHVERIGQTQRIQVAIDLSGVEGFNTSYDPQPLQRFQQQMADIANVTFVGVDVGLRSSLTMTGIHTTSISERSLTEWLQQQAERQAGV